MKMPDEYPFLPEDAHNLLQIKMRRRVVRRSKPLSVKKTNELKKGRANKPVSRPPIIKTNEVKEEKEEVKQPSTTEDKSRAARARKRAETLKEEKTEDYEVEIKHEHASKKKKAAKEVKNEKVHCDVCDKTFKSNIAFAMHSINHSEDGKYSCHMCTYTTPMRHHFEWHIKKHEGRTQFKCEICHKGFRVKKYAIEHKYLHTGERPFQCEICGKSFRYSSFLCAHRRSAHWEIITGTPLTKYDCAICNKHYSTRCGLNKHNFNHHNEQRVDASVICTVCGKRLANPKRLKLHEVIHTGHKPYTCTVCSKSFSKRDYLREHQRIHTGEKPHVCQFCGKGFSQRTPQKVHERTHTGERPYVCRLCKKGFTSKGGMDAHMKTCDIVVEKYDCDESEASVSSVD